MDYTATSEVLTFAACETQRCVNVTIIDDLTLETEETFDVTLNRTADLDNRITLDPAAEEIQIIDNDCV